MSTAVSVVMSVYNGRDYLHEQVQSVLTQLELQDELIVIDDASTDESMDIIRAFNSPRIRLFRNDTNLGVRRSFERGLNLAHGEVVFLCDQDDLWLPGKRAAFVQAFAEDPEVTVVVSDAEVIDATGELISHSFMASRGGFSGTVRATVWRNRFMGCAMAVRRPVLKWALPIPPKAPMHDMWLGVIGCLAGRVRYLAVPYVRYRRHGQNASPCRPNPPHVMLALRAALLSTLASRLLAVTMAPWHDVTAPAGSALEAPLTLDSPASIPEYT
jgi:glycosyltransferase involved in cell wall biosynthesis